MRQVHDTGATRRFLRGQAGIFLIEALIALVVLGVGMIALVKFQATLANSGAVAKQRSEATMLGQREIEALRGFVSATAYDAYFAGSNPATLTRTVAGENASYAISATLTDHNLTLGGRHADVDLKVAWTDQKGEAHQVHLNSTFPRLDPVSSGLLLTAPGTTTPPTPVCPAGATKTWSVDNINCTGPITAAGVAGATQLVTATVNQGTNQYVCLLDGSWAPVPSYPKTCESSCPSQLASWTGTAGASCSATLPQAASGATTTLTDSTAPVTGSATYSCTNGAWSLAASPAAACTATCAGGVHTWDTLLYGGTNRCQTTLTTLTAPQTLLIDNSVAGELTATATYECTNLGTWSKTASSCAFTATNPGYCRADSISWTVGSLSCTGLRPQTPSGQSYTISITEGSRIGQATYGCASGTWSATPTSAACNANCFVRLSGSVDASANQVYVNGIPASCTVSNKTYLCSSLAVTEGANVTVQAIKSNGDASGAAKTLSGPACGQAYTLNL